MTLRSAICRSALGLSLMCAGCAATSPSRDSLLSRFSALRRTESDTDVPAQSEPDAKFAADRKSPGREESDPATRTRSLAASRPASQQFDPETLTLIEAELRDCPPAERQQWMDLLQSIDPASIPYALQARRMEASKSATSSANSGQMSAANAAGNPPQNGHSTMAVTAGAPAGGVTPPASTSATTSSSLASRLNAPEPETNSASQLGVSPFGRSADRNIPEMPALQAGYSTGTTELQSPQYTAMQAVADQPTPAIIPSISPNQPGEVPVPPASEAGRILPMGRLDVMPSTEMPLGIQTPDADQSNIVLGAYWQDTLKRLTSLVETEVAASNPGLSDAERLDFVKQQVWLRMLYLMAEQPQRAQSAIPGIDPAEQEFWTALFWAVSNYFDNQTIPDSSERAAQTLEQLTYAQNRLQQLAALQLHNVSFCYKINSFGNFESWQRDEFHSGQRVLLYAEISNFESRPDSAGQFATRLKSNIEIRRGRADGELVEQNSLPVTEDACRSIRHDYFHSYTIDLPQHLKPGPYTLILRVEDEFSGKTAVHPISFLIR